MNKKIISYDLGTGGLKASLFSQSGKLLCFEFEAYDTHNISATHQEQAPQDWWNAIIHTTRKLLENSQTKGEDILALAISGHSLGVVPLDAQGQLLQDRTPIWSDKRAHQEAAEYFTRIDYQDWYMTTGNGFPPECYSLFKILWYKKNMPDMFAKVRTILGTKDYCNYLFTGKIATDHSYASGSGIYDLHQRCYRDDYREAAGLSPDIFPPILESTDCVGTLSEEASAVTGLPRHVKVICGGVDNSCMALGAGGFRDGHVYTSLGTSAWIALSSYKPILNFQTKPYVFAHVVKNMYASATCIFSAGSSLEWVLQTFFSELEGKDKYQKIRELASSSPIGAKGLLFNPSLAGGSMLEPSPHISGAFAGLSLAHNKADILRATLEGIALNLRIALDELKKENTSISSMLMVGGGAKDTLWLQIFASAYQLKCLQSSINQECAALGAAALAAYGAGLWTDFSPIEQQHNIEATYYPEEEAMVAYDKELVRFKKLANFMAQLGDTCT